ncbi:MAG: C40 family peptidase [Spirochaetaceae bacterium]|jgi:hypothetical protein|nr:C40 family peptidase [Spirochaetaceae bacterium]
MRPGKVRKNGLVNIEKPGIIVIMFLDGLLSRGMLPMKKTVLAGACFLLILDAAFALDPLRQKIIDAAKEYVGVPYVYGAASPEGFDCSGFVGYVYNAAAGIALPRTSKNIWTSGQAVQNAQPGDIIVFDTVGGAPSHVAILLDDETMIHAVSQGPRTGVIISPVQDRYFAPRVMGTRSFIGPARSGPQAAGTPSGAGQNSPANQTDGAELVGLTISGRPVISSDRIPIARGSMIRFALTNSSGRDGVFEVLFYKLDPDPAKHITISQGRVAIKNSEMAETPVFTFAENGQYRLIIKTNDNRKLLERTWRVLEL